MPYKIESALLVCLALTPTGLPAAQWRTSQDAEICIVGTGNRGLDIAVCSRALGRDEPSALDRASIYSARGRAYRDSGRLAKALADFDAALALNPLSAETFNARAVALDRSGDYQRALDDFTRALALSPQFAAAHKNRAVAHFFAGNLACARADFDAAAALFDADAEIHAFRGFLHYLAGRYREAAEDFQRVGALGLPYPYLPLWRYLAGWPSGADPRESLAAARAALLPDEWPKPLLDVYLGERDATTLTAGLEGDDKTPESRRRAAASHYYIAALETLNGRSEQALRHFTRTLALSEHRVPERVLAEHALSAPAGEPSTKLPGDC